MTPPPLFCLFAILSPFDSPPSVTDSIPRELVVNLLHYFPPRFANYRLKLSTEYVRGEVILAANVIRPDPKDRNRTQFTLLTQVKGRGAFTRALHALGVGASTTRPRERKEHEGGRQQSLPMGEEQPPVDRLAEILTTAGFILVYCMQRALGSNHPFRDIYNSVGLFWRGMDWLLPGLLTNMLSKEKHVFFNCSHLRYGAIVSRKRHFRNRSEPPSLPWPRTFTSELKPVIVSG